MKLHFTNLPLFGVNWQFRYATNHSAVPGVNWQFRRDPLAGVNWQIGMGRLHPALLPLTFLLLTLVLSSLGPVPALSFPANVQPVLLDMARQQPDEPVNILVQKMNPATGAEAAVARLGGIVTQDLPIINAFAATIPASAAPKLGENPAVRQVSYDAPVVKTGNIDTSSLLSSGVQNINADLVWNKKVGGTNLQGQGIGVAVVDSGIDNTLSDFDDADNNSRIVGKTNMINPLQAAGDGFGHGTFVAGVIGGNGQASGGAYSGVAPGVNLINVKVSNDSGAAKTSTVIMGLGWILLNKSHYNIRVVNISLNSAVKQSCNVDPLCAATEVLWFSGIVVVVSAGNNGTADLYPPANDPFVITVGAVDDQQTFTRQDNNPSLVNHTMATFSAWGNDEAGNAKPDLVAPGRKVISTMTANDSFMRANHPERLVDGAYFSMSGTSVSAPMVAGAVALLLQAQPNLNPDQVKYRLKATAVQNQPRWEGDSRIWPDYDPVKAGAGYLDVYAAVTQTGLNQTANTGLATSKLLSSGSGPQNWSSVNWSSVNWSSVNWSSVNWSSVNWSSVTWVD